jgi:EAL domain-containing protein (putative c-di-GMP-specific phosphodiesterase class I)
LDAALDAGLLTVAYQPIVSLRTGQVVAAEALARLQDPRTGLLLPPDAFIPLAEATGRIARIDRMVLAQAAPLAAGWRRRLGSAPFSIGINLSVAGLTAPGLVDYIRDTCSAANLPPHALTLEITETVLSADDGEDGSVLRAIDDLGCRVVMDDFGTGYSSMSHLASFPISGIKIDRRFVWELGTRGLGGLVGLALVRLGSDLGIDVVAEGVETKEQLAALEYADCPSAQGYLFSRPLPAEQLTAFLTSHRRAVPLPRAERS